MAENVDIQLLDISWLFNHNSLNGKNKFVNYFKILKEAASNDRLLNYQFYDLEFVKTIHNYIYDYYFK